MVEESSEKKFAALESSTLADIAPYIDMDEGASMGRHHVVQKLTGQYAGHVARYLLPVTDDSIREGIIEESKTEVAAMIYSQEVTTRINEMLEVQDSPWRVEVPEVKQILTLESAGGEQEYVGAIITEQDLKGTKAIYLGDTTEMWKKYLKYVPYAYRHLNQASSLAELRTSIEDVRKSSFNIDEMEAFLGVTPRPAGLIEHSEYEIAKSAFEQAKQRYDNDEAALDEFCMARGDMMAKRVLSGETQLITDLDGQRQIVTLCQELEEHMQTEEWTDDNFTEKLAGFSFQLRLDLEDHRGKPLLNHPLGSVMRLDQVEGTYAEFVEITDIKQVEEIVNRMQSYGLSVDTFGNNLYKRVNADGSFTLVVFDVSRQRPRS